MRRFCCFSLIEDKDIQEEARVKNLEESSKPNEKENEETEEIHTINNISPPPPKDKLVHRLSFGSSQPGSISCPHLLIETPSSSSSYSGNNEEKGFRNSLRSDHRNDSPGRRHYGTSSQKYPHPRNSNHQNSFLTQTNSFKRIISFRSSKKEICLAFGLYYVDDVIFSPFHILIHCWSDGTNVIRLDIWKSEFSTVKSRHHLTEVWVAKF
ncbi:unnamed protein product [Lepeophtheirus salmonis]|uniref:(salmon louse) hypothetical protein n=1 Tax=Lepeophtheirus salmonis TaxID=72036 RepID=A0A7R8CNL0_LEPSM|nr:unnamed protein product [Lepeophtheirus salmonis]CAF2873439.1 unnamed protein product [Lepeophtheirus salmonis]